MTIEEYNLLSKELQQIVRQIPLKWGMVQNNIADSAINMFAIKNFAQLDAATQTLPTEEKKYFMRRWFL